MNPNEQPENSKMRRDAITHLEKMERWFWEHVEYRMELTGQTEQEILDSIREPGFTNRIARKKRKSSETEN
jgi:hypothetical protein